MSMNIELIKEQYFRELDGKVQQDGRTTLQVAVLTVLGGVLVVAYQGLAPASGWQAIVLGCLFWPGLAAFVFALIQVLRANIGHLYERLPSADVQYQYFKKLERYYTHTSKVSGSPTADFEDYLARRMVQSAARNSNVNQRRAAIHYNAVRGMAWVVVFALPAAGLSLAIQEDAKDRLEKSRSHLAEISGLQSQQGGNAVADKPESSPAESQPAETAPESPPPKPAEPENVVFKGGKVPEKRTPLPQDAEKK
jgi:hypothetical protein